jgi:D-alanyl-D-alanine dipeptidase
MTDVLETAWAEVQPHNLVLMGDQRVQDIPCLHLDESLTDVADVDELAVDPRLADSEGHHRLLRASVVDRLVTASRRLGGRRIAVIEGFRPIELQSRYFREQVQIEQARHPTWTREECERAATAFVARPSPLAPHATGAAVDLTLLDTEERAELDFGIAVNATSGPDAVACNTGYPQLTDESRRNRRILVCALRDVGLVNYPTEWWHWSYGDRYWAYRTGHAAALHGPAQHVPVPRRPSAPGERP